MFQGHPFTHSWFLTTIGTWVVVMILDELSYYWWKSYHPDSVFSGVIAKHAIQNTPNPPMSGAQGNG